jgi:DNA-binding NtrC family response regulator
MIEQHQILVVEDDPLVSELIVALLSDTYPAAVAETCAEAMALLGGGGFRLMLLDCTLPDGVDAALLPQADRLGTAVILMSGDPGRVASLSDRPRPFLLKPFTLAGLLETVENVLASTDKL